MALARRRRRLHQVRRGFALVLVGVDAGAQGLTQVEVGDGARRHPRAPDRSEEEQDEAEEQRGPRRVDELAGALGGLLGGLGLVRGIWWVEGASASGSGWGKSVL